MNIKLTQLARVIKELAEPIKGMFLNKVYQPAWDEWVLELRRTDKKLWILVCLAQGFCRLHLVPAPPSHAVEPGPFAKLVKKNLRNKPVARITQLEGDRVAFIDFATSDGGYRLVAELTGSTGNLYLLNPAGLVMALALARKSRNMPGKPYLAPTPGDIKAEPAPDNQDEDQPLAFNRWLAEHNARPADEYRLNEAKRKAQAPLRAELKKAAKRLAALIKEKDALERYKDHKRLGDLLQANFSAIKKGAGQVEVEDIFSTPPQVITISLNPAISPAGNIRRYYKKSSKYVKGTPRIEKETALLCARRAELEKQKEFIESARKIEELAGQVGKPSGNTAPSRRKPASQPSGPRRFISSDGLTILVGRNDRENDQITFRTSNGRDLWLHARDYPGSHVLVRIPNKGETAPQSTLREAAMLAIHYSKAAKSGKGEVTYANVKNIRKPKGAPPGKVLVSGAKSIMIRTDESLIQKMKIKPSSSSGV